MIGVEGLEQVCEQPGMWLIEGLQVRRHRLGDLVWWVIVWEPGVRSEQVPTLAEARRRIVDAINEGRL